MQALWTGSLTFGLVTMPVKLYRATKEKRLDLDMLHKKDHAPIRYARICRADGKEIPWNEVVKGYEYKDGDYVILTDDDLHAFSPKRSETLAITDFVAEQEIDPMLFEQPYYLEPQKGTEKAYALLREALTRTKKVGIGEFVLHNRNHLGIIKPEGRALIFNQMRFPKEIRPESEIKLPKKTEIKGKEIKMAIELIESMTSHFDPADYADTYEEELEGMIKKKAHGKTVHVKKESSPSPTKVKDLVKALKSSLEEQPRKHHHAG